LFGARSARDSSGGSKAHNQILTEFMQEMDGLSSASANRDARVVVVGATNRPFDLDDAILRRLPRRLLVDLPTEDDRKGELSRSAEVTDIQRSWRSCSRTRTSPPTSTYASWLRGQRASLALT
jgi:SpoVK/Ycf46/Vps4 family AAA+-type ATPase